MAAATFNVAVPRSVLDTFAGSPWLSVLFLAALAIILAVCSEADAFVASSLTGFSPRPGSRSWSWAPWST